MDINGELEWVGTPRKGNYEEHYRYHRKRVEVEFRLKGDPNVYSLEAMNLLFGTGKREKCYFFYFHAGDNSWNAVKTPGIEHLCYVDDTIPLISNILNQHHVKMYTDWLNINKPIEKIGHTPDKKFS
jgi:hypothetical protein